MQNGSKIDAETIEAQEEELGRKQQWDRKTEKADSSSSSAPDKAWPVQHRRWHRPGEETHSSRYGMCALIDPVFQGEAITETAPFFSFFIQLTCLYFLHLLVIW